MVEDGASGHGKGFVWADRKATGVDGVVLYVEIVLKLIVGDD